MRHGVKKGKRKKSLKQDWRLPVASARKGSGPPPPLRRPPTDEKWEVYSPVEIGTSLVPLSPGDVIGVLRDEEAPVLLVGGPAPIAQALYDNRGGEEVVLARGTEEEMRAFVVRMEQMLPSLNCQARAEETSSSGIWELYSESKINFHGLRQTLSEVLYEEDRSLLKDSPTNIASALQTNDRYAVVVIARGTKEQMTDMLERMAALSHRLSFFIREASEERSPARSTRY